MEDDLTRQIAHLPREVVEKISAKGEHWLPLSDDRVEGALGRVVQLVREGCRESLRQEDEASVDAWLFLLDEFSPDPTTGRHDLLWAYIRDLQPASLGVGNPKYERADIAMQPSRASSQSSVDYPSNWRDIVNKSAESIYDRMRS